MSVSQIINVVVNSKGAVTVQKQLSAMGDSARDTTNYLNTLRAILTSVLTFSGMRNVIEAADNFTNLSNKLKIVADETENLGDNWNRLMDIARNSYSTIDTTVDLYFRVAQAYKAWGESAEKAYQFTESFQKAAILSGSSMQTTAQAVYQFGQALNKGKLDGDEFRSVMEGLPYVSNILQKSLGVTRAELYKMSEQGLISLDKIKEAFEGAADVIKKDFTNITPTIGMAMNVLRSSWTNFIGDIQTSTGVFSGVAQIILLVADNFKLLAIALAPVMLSITFLAGRAGLGLVVLGLTDLAKALNLAAAAQWALNVAMNANPIVIVGTLLAGIVVAVYYFRDSLGLTNEVLLTLWNTALSVLGYFLTAFNPISAAVNMLVQQFGGWLKLWETLKSLVVAVGQSIVGMFNSAVSGAKAAASYIASSLIPVWNDLSKLANSFWGLMLDIAKTVSDELSPAIDAILPIFRAVWEYVEPALTKFIGFVSDVYQGWVNIGSYLKGTFFPFIKDSFDGWIVIIRAVIGWVQNLIDILRRAIQLMNQVRSWGGGGGSGGAHYGAQFTAGEGFASGGQFKVGGTNSGRDTTPVAFRAERGERVTVETRKQQRANDNSDPAEVNVPVQIVNVFDPRMVPAANQTVEGRRSIVNAIAADRDEIAALLGVA